MIDQTYRRSPMLLANVEGFLEVARQQNMRRAAEALHLSQPALSGRIQALEAELGASLFLRGRTGMTLTAAGRAFVPYAERALETLRGGAALVRDVERGAAGELAIGAAAAVSAYVLPELLARFTARHPQVRLLVRTGHSEEIVEAVVRGDVAIGMVRELRDGRVASHPLYADELVLVARPGHPFAEQGRIDVGRLGEARLILFDRTSSYYGLTNALLRTSGVAPQGIMELDNIEAAKRMVERGLGVALLPGTAIADALEAGSLVRVALLGADPIRRRIVAVERPQSGEPSSALAGFRELLGRIPELISGARSIEREE
jgi:DNA-binding transcriptional LysR family regulator